MMAVRLGAAADEVVFASVVVMVTHLCRADGLEVVIGAAMDCVNVACTRLWP